MGFDRRRQLFVEAWPPRGSERAHSIASNGGRPAASVGSRHRDERDEARSLNRGRHVGDRVRQRGRDRPRLAPADVEHFASIVGSSNLVTDADALAAYNTDWMGKFTGSSRLAVRPGSTDEVSRILRHCNERGIAVVPQGGNTGLVGGSVPLGDEVVAAFDRAWAACKHEVPCYFR